MQNIKLSGDEPTPIFSFIARYHHAWVLAEVSELEANIMLRDFIYGNTRAFLVSVLQSYRSVTDIRDCPTAVKWLLLNCATEHKVNRAVNHLL